MSEQWRQAFELQVPSPLRELRGDRWNDDVSERLTRELVQRRTADFANGFHVSAQRAFMRALQTERGEQVLWGTIDARNHASRITARKAGRPEHAAWHWVRVAAR